MFFLLLSKEEEEEEEGGGVDNKKGLKGWSIGNLEKRGKGVKGVGVFDNEMNVTW